MYTYISNYINLQYITTSAGRLTASPKLLFGLQLQFPVFSSSVTRMVRLLVTLSPLAVSVRSILSMGRENSVSSPVGDVLVQTMVGRG